MANAWKIARRSNVQLPLILVVALAVVLVLLGKAQGTLFDKMRAHATDTMAPVLEKVRVPVAGFGRWMGSITEIFSVYQENLRLKEENARLRQWRNVAIVLQGRVGRYQAPPALAARWPHCAIGAGGRFLPSVVNSLDRRRISP